MTKNEFYFSSANKKARMRAVEWLPEGEPKAVLHLFYDEADSVQSYEELAEFFSGHGFVVIESNHPDRKDNHSEQEELYLCLKAARQRYPDVPYLLMGLSRAASVVNSFICEHPRAVEGVVIADAEKKAKVMAKKLPVLQVSGIEENCQEAFGRIYRWTEERLDEMLYCVATKQ